MRATLKNFSILVKKRMKISVLVAGTPMFHIFPFIYYN